MGSQGRWLAAVLGFAALMLGAPALAKNAVAAGVLHVERPTLVSLGFDWRIAGDDNRNASVAVAYRKKGERAWRTGLPLMRAQNEQVGTAPGPGGQDSEGRYPLFKYTVGNMFAGSLLNLDPDTEYEARFTLTDPDGVAGKAVRIVAAKTRAEPMPAKGRARLSCLSGGLERAQAGARLQQPDLGLLHGPGPLRL